MTATPAPTFERIRHEIERRQEGTRARDITALAKLQEEVGADFDHRADVFFQDDATFESAVEAHVARMTSRSGSPASSASRSQRRSGLRRVRTIAHEVANVGDAGWDTLARAISSCRRRIGLSQRQMAIQYSPSLRDYEHSKHVPRETARPALEALADAAGVEREALTRFVTSRRKPRTESEAQGGPSHPHYGLAALGYAIPGMTSAHRQNGNIKAPLPDDCPLKLDVEQFVEFKKSRFPPGGLIRHSRSRWTTNANGECTSAETYGRAISSFFGFVHQILGVPLEHLTLPMVADVVILEAYDRYLRDRGTSGLSEHPLGLALMLVRESVNARGYVRQQRNRFGPYIYGNHGYLGSPTVRALYERRFTFDGADRDAAGVLDALRCFHHDLDDVGQLDVDDRQRHQDWCDYHARIVASWMRDLDDDEDEHASLDGVRALIGQTTARQERPIIVLRELLDGIEKERSKYPPGHYDLLALDYAAAIIAFQGSIPLREGNLRSVRLHSSLVHAEAREHLPLCRPSLYPTDDGGLVFSEHKDYFKNRRALASRGIEYFEAPIAAWALPYVHHFLVHVRPNLNGAFRGSPFLFPGQSPEKRINRSKLGDRIAYITDMVFGHKFRIHWFRHLIATDILATHPEALNFVAMLLQDDLETVREMYDRSRPSDAARFAHRYQELAMA